MVSILFFISPKDLEVAPSLRALQRAVENARESKVECQVLAIRGSEEPFLQAALAQFSGLFDESIQVTGSVGQAWNRAVSKARGEFFAIVRSRDVVHPNWILKCLQCHKENESLDPVLRPEFLFFGRGAPGILPLADLVPDTMALGPSFGRTSKYRKVPFEDLPNLNEDDLEHLWSRKAAEAGCLFQSIPGLWHYLATSYLGLCLPKRNATVAEQEALRLIGTEDFLFQWSVLQELVEGKISRPPPDLHVVEASAEFQEEKRVTSVCKEALGDRIDYVIFIHWLKRGGAERIALRWLKELFLKYPEKKVAMIGTENRTSEWVSRLPLNVKWVPFGQLASGLGLDIQKRALLTLLIEYRPQFIQCMISNLGWELFREHAKTLRGFARLFASSYCIDFGRDGKPHNYCLSHLPVCYEEIDLVITDNFRHASELAQYLDFRKVEVLYPYPDEPFRSPVLRKSDRPLQILWAGRFDFQKRVDILLEIAQRTPEFRYQVYGEFVADISDRNGIVERLRHLPNVTFQGTYDDFQKIPFEDIDVFLYTSGWDGLPNVLIEAASMGLPIVAPAVGGVTELLNENNSFLVPSVEAVEVFISELTRLAGSPELALERALQAQKDILSKFSRNHYQAVQAKVFERLGFSGLPESNYQVRAENPLAKSFETTL